MRFCQRMCCSRLVPTSDAYSSAYASESAYSGSNLIMQNQVNAGLELGKGGVLIQTNDANAVKPKIPTLDPIIIQNQANLGALISTGSILLRQNENNIGRGSISSSHLFSLITGNLINYHYMI